MSDYRKAQTILFYVSYDNEVYTHDMIEESISNGKKVIVPKTDKTNIRLILSELTCLDDLIPGAYNILEPKKECLKETSIDSIDLMFIPGVVFDIRGNRIGHGKGYYDDLLKDSTKVLHIGLAYELQVLNSIPAEEHDIPMDKIVTEKRVINCVKE